MNTFKDLKINNFAEFKAFVSKNTSSDHWKRNQEKELELSEIGNEQICFEYIGKLLPSSLLWVSDDAGGINGYVTNIIPMNKSSLSIDEYNELIDVWADEYLKNYPHSYTIGSAERTIESEYGKTASDALKYFSEYANKSTGHSHPLDEKRWFEFIYETIIYGKMIEGELLRHELALHGWNEDSAYDLSLDYEYGYSAMKFALEAQK